ncbi:MAG: T9SS type A sorting domain-containing protein [Bacteroidota bacterium]
MKKYILILVLIFNVIFTFSQSLIFSVNDNPITLQPNEEYLNIQLCDSIELISYNDESIDTSQFNIKKRIGTTSSFEFYSNYMLNNNILEFTEVGIYAIYILGNYYYYISIIECSTSVVKENNYFGIQELISFPNPIIDNITIKFNANKTDTPVYVFDLNGQLVYLDNENKDIGMNTIELNTSKFKEGVYLIKVGSETVKFVK